MTRHILITASNPKPGQEDEYHRWYVEEHLDEVLTVPGFVAAQRFKLSSDMGMNLRCSYLTVYEIEANDGPTAVANLQAKQLPRTHAQDTTTIQACLITATSERKVATKT